VFTGAKKTTTGRSNKKNSNTVADLADTNTPNNCYYNLMNTIAIVGYGRFGELLHELLAPKFELAVIENEEARAALAREKSIELIELKDLARFDTVIFAVPISSLDSVVAAAAECISDNQLVMDVCSVKVHPANVLRKYLPNAKLVATHPMFGPDSASRGLSGLQVAICPLNATDEVTTEVCSLWEGLGLDVIVTTPEAHDKDSVLSQAFTYSIAHIILGMELNDIKLTTRSFNAITEVAYLSGKDSQQLFHDMLYYNPYFSDMKKELIGSIDSTLEKLDEIESEQRKSGIFSS
jgi:prephenate dehydrogenase